MGWPEITWIGLTAAGLGIAMTKHGEPQRGRHNFWITTISTAILTMLPYYGGFFA